MKFVFDILLALTETLGEAIYFLDSASSIEKM